MRSEGFSERSIRWNLRWQLLLDVGCRLKLWTVARWAALVGWLTESLSS